MGQDPWGGALGFEGFESRPENKAFRSCLTQGIGSGLARTERGARLDLVVQSVRVRVSGRSFIACTTVQHHGVEETDFYRIQASDLTLLSNVEAFEFVKQLRVRPRGRISGGNFVSKPAKKDLTEPCHSGYRREMDSQGSGRPTVALCLTGRNAKIQNLVTSLNSCKRCLAPRCRSHRVPRRWVCKPARGSLGAPFSFLSVEESGPWDSGVEGRAQTK